MPSEWRELPAGPEMDALVAERVLGWTNCHVALGNARGIPPEFADKQPPDRTINFPGKAWSRVISSAWEVVEAMEARGYSLALDTKCPGMPYVMAGFQSSTPGSIGRAKTVPLAICRAALAALDMEVPHG